MTRRVSEYFDMSFGGIQESQKHFDSSGFSGTIRAQQSKNLATLHLEINIVDRLCLGTPPEIFEYLC